MHFQSLRVSHSAASRGGVEVRAASQKLCKDVISAPRTEFKGQGKTYSVTFLSQGESRTIECPDDEYILDAADQNGIDLPATCRGGICGACVARVAKGQVDMSDIDDLEFTLEPEEIADGMSLLCMARPTEDVVIETQCDWGVSLGFQEWKGASGKFVGEVNPLMGKKWSEADEKAAEA